MKGCASKIAGVGCAAVLLICALFVLAMLFIDDVEESKEIVAKMSAPSLYVIYSKNEIDADDKYKDKYLEIDGYADVVGKNVVGSPYITLLTNDLVGRVQCMIADQSVSKAATIKKGQLVTLVGKCNGKELVNIVLYECTFKNDAKAASQSENINTQVVETKEKHKETPQPIKENASPKPVDTPQNGTFIDERDKKTYKYVTIGKLVWMAENLNFKAEDSWCYDDKIVNCKKFGRLYTYDAAMSACPEGWHLPSINEWKYLFSVVEGERIDDLGLSIMKSKVAKKLKSTSGWNEGWDDNGKRSGNGDDTYGFAALPAGIRTIHDDYNSLGEYAFFWTSTEYHTTYDPKYTQLDDTEGLSKHADHISFVNKSDWPNFAQYGKKILGHSVRCVKNFNN